VQYTRKFLWLWQKPVHPTPFFCISQPEQGDNGEEIPYWIRILLF